MAVWEPSYPKLAWKDFVLARYDDGSFLMKVERNWEPEVDGMFRRDMIDGEPGRLRVDTVWGDPPRFLLMPIEEPEQKP